MPSAPLALAVLGRGVVDPAEPWVRADDEAVLRGRAAFETVRVYAGLPFRLAAHLDRLAASAAVLELPPPPADELTALAAAAVAAAGVPDAVLRLVFTPGPEGGPPSAFALVTALPPALDDQRARGIALATMQLAIGTAARSESPWLLPGVKSTSYAVNMAAQAEARRRGADDALLLSLEGVLLEGPTSNIWFAERGCLRTPALDLGILAGVTRTALLEACAGQGIAVEEGAYGIERLRAAEEVFTSSSVREVMPVVAVDGRPVGAGAPGVLAVRMQAALRRAAGAAQGGPA